MNISTEQCDQSEPLADANGRTDNLMNDNGWSQYKSILTTAVVCCQQHQYLKFN